MVGPHTPLQWAWQPEPADRSRHTGGGHLPPKLGPERGCPQPLARWLYRQVHVAAAARGVQKHLEVSLICSLPSEKEMLPTVGGEGRDDFPHTYTGTHTHTHAHTLMPQLQALPIGLQTLAISQGVRWVRRRKR